jgi:signal transduction histidine kinase
VLSLVSAPNPKIAIQGMANTLAEALHVRGVLVVMTESGNDLEGNPAQLLLSNGTLQGPSDNDMLAAVESVESFAGYLREDHTLEPLSELPASDTTKLFQQVFQRLGGQDRLVALGLRMFGRHRTEGSTLCLMIFDLGRQRSLDRFEAEAVQATIAQFPRVVENLTSRFAQAELSEKLLDESRRSDEIMEQMLSGFQHDVANALRNMEQAVETAHASLQNQPAYQGLDNPDKAFEELQRTVSLAGQVAHSASMLPEMAKGEMPMVEPRPHDPALLFSRLLQPLISVKANARKDLVVNFEVAPGLPQMMVDEVPFFRALSNVIGNAFKFTERGGVNILVYKDAPYVAFAVSDTGIGIPDNELEQVGGLRFRTSNAVDFSGSGIGLWTTMRLAEAMGGNLAIESKLGRGSTITLRVPIADQD